MLGPPFLISSGLQQIDLGIILCARFYVERWDNHCWWEGTMVHLWQKRDWKMLRRLNIELPYDPAILLEMIVYT